MEVDKNNKTDIKEEKKDSTKGKKKKTSTRKIVVLVVLLAFLIVTYIAIRAEYLNTIEIGQEYETVFIE